jgi:hypothetical protein
MRHQPLLLDRPLVLQLILAIVVPVAYGLFTGWSLAQDETLYLVLSLLGILGGIAAGYDHLGAGQGALRGVLGGALFGTAILLGHSIWDDAAKADIPDPQWVLVVITTVLGALFGAWGGALRARSAKRDETAAAA